MNHQVITHSLIFFFRLTGRGFVLIQSVISSFSDWFLIYLGPNFLEKYCIRVGPSQVFRLDHWRIQGG